MYVYMCIYVSMYVCMYLCTYVCTYVCVYINTHTYIYMYVYKCIYVCMCARLPAKPCQATNQVGLICPAVHELIGLTGHVVVSWCFEVLCGARNCSGLIHGMTLLQYINSTKTGDGLSMLWIEYALYAQSLWFSLVVFGSHVTQVTRFKIIELLT